MIYREAFFLVYHLKLGLQEAWSLPPHERKWYIDTFVEQKEKEHKAIKTAKQ